MVFYLLSLTLGIIYVYDNEVHVLPHMCYSNFFIHYIKAEEKMRNGLGVLRRKIA